MVTVGALEVDLSANSAAFKADMGKAQASLRTGSARMNRSLAKLDRGFAGVSAGVQKMNRRMGGLRGAVAILAGSAGFGLLVKNSLDTADSIAKVADSVGISTGALQELRFAGELAGVSTQSLDSAMQAFSKRIGELRQETGTLTTFLNKLDAGFAAQVQASQNVDQAFELIINRAAAMGNQMDRNALLAAAFGRTAGIQMSNMIKNGSASLEEMRAKARELGVVMEDSLLRNAEAAKDELFKMSQVVSVELTSAVVSLAPLIISLSKGFAELSRMARLGLEGFADMADRGLARLQFDLDKTNEKIVRLQMTIDNPGSNPAILTTLSTLKAELADAETVARQLEARIAFLSDRDTKVPLTVTVTKPAETLPFKISGPGEFDDFERAAKAAAERAADLRIETQRAAEEGVKRLREEGKRLTEAVNPTVAYNNEMVRLRELVAAGAINMDTFERAAARATERLAEQTQQTHVLATATDDLMISAINGQIKSWQDLGRVAISILQRIIAEEIRAASVTSSGGLFGALIGGISSLGSVGATSVNTFGGFQGFEDGGRTKADVPIVVGEKRPEVFVPDRAGTIIPEVPRGGGNTINIYIDARGSNGDAGVEAAVDRSLAKAGPLIVDASVKKVRDGARRDPRMFQ